MVRKVLLGAIALVALFAAPAAAQYDPIVVSPGQVNPGGAVTVTGQACAPGVEVVINLIPGDATDQNTPINATKAAPTLPAGGVQVATTTADENGNFTVTFDLPAGTAAGTYTVQAVCGSVVQSDVIDVQPATVATTVPAGTPSTPSSPTGNLPRTGSNVNGMGLVGAGLLAAGGLLLLGTRKRRSDALAA